MSAIRKRWHGLGKPDGNKSRAEADAAQKRLGQVMARGRSRNVKHLITEDPCRQRKWLSLIAVFRTSRAITFDFRWQV